MHSLINKINFYHSIIFFLFSCSIALAVNQFENLIISPVVCLFLILTIGISHGALDDQKGKKLSQLYNVKKSYFFYLIYSLIGIGIIIFWLFFPTMSLILFLIVASYHFGKEDTEFLINNKNVSNLILYFSKGSLIIIAPLMFHFIETINIFKLLLIENEKFYLFLNFIEDNSILLFALSISLLSNIYYFLKDFKIINILIFLDFFSIIVLNYFLTPLVAFTIYFCFLHSFRHSISLITELNEKSLKIGVMTFIKKAMPLTVLTAILYIISLYFLSNFYQLNDAILKVIFIGLASLTFPHILLEYLLEKNEK
ncbi:Brp/Blh family beta-carotene 15,15'-dioxygenase [Pelagibacteraceae bacterium]|nr:Brp/Blh family beta-carotene 15,15'-dioxygenase [Candidatus Pelagibacter bacterium]MDC1253845.1 Brp/Blh family beta-carotene 15,15'-dioxygenase [Pelagibacteraceae bacterium]